MQLNYALFKVFHVTRSVYCLVYGVVLVFCENHLMIIQTPSRRAGCIDVAMSSPRDDIRASSPLLTRFPIGLDLIRGGIKHLL